MISKNTRKKILAATVVGLCSLPFSAVASAADEVNSAVVNYGDLNMTTVEGLETLHRRLRHAARKVCGSQSITNVGLARAVRNRECAEQALDYAIAKVHRGTAVAVTVSADENRES